MTLSALIFGTDLVIWSDTSIRHGYFVFCIVLPPLKLQSARDVGAINNIHILCLVSLVWWFAVSQNGSYLCGSWFLGKALLVWIVRHSTLNNAKNTADVFNIWSSIALSVVIELVRCSHNDFHLFRTFLFYVQNVVCIKIIVNCKWTCNNLGQWDVYIIRCFIPLGMISGECR